MIDIKLFVQVSGTGSPENDWESWGKYRFLTIPDIGAQFSVFRRLELRRVEVTEIVHHPIPVEPNELDEPIWPPSYTESEIWINAGLVSEI